MINIAELKIIYQNVFAQLKIKTLTELSKTSPKCKI